MSTSPDRTRKSWSFVKAYVTEPSNAKMRKMGRRGGPVHDTGDPISPSGQTSTASALASSPANHAGPLTS